MLLAAWILAGPAVAAAPSLVRTCARTSASANANVRWDVLEQRGKDGDRQAQEGELTASTELKRIWSWEKSADLCRTDAPLHALIAAGTRMYEVALPAGVPGAGAPTATPGPASCLTTSRARVEGSAQSAVELDADAIRARAVGRTDVNIVSENNAVVDTDWGAGTHFATVWAYRHKSPATAVEATVTIELSETYAGARVEVPELFQLIAWEGVVEGWVRDGDHYTRVRQPAPVTLTARANFPGKSGDVCLRGSVSSGAQGDRLAGRLSGVGIVDVRVTVGPTEHFPASIEGELPEFDPCGCP